MKVSSTFSKVVESRGKASGRPPQRAELSCAHRSAGGDLRGNPRRGFPLFFFALCVCADTLGGSRYPVLPFDPISLVLAQRNGVEPPKKSAFLPRRLHHPRERCCLGGRDVPRPTWGGGWWFTGRSSQLDAVGGDVGASSPWERRVGPYMSRGSTHKRVSLGLHPVSLGKTKEMGWKQQRKRKVQQGKTASSAQPKPNPGRDWNPAPTVVRSGR